MNQRTKIIVCLVMFALVALSFLFMPLSAKGANVGDYQVSQCTNASGSMPTWAVKTVTPAANAYSLAGFSNTAVAGVPVASNYTFGTGFTISGSAPNFVISTTESPGGATWGSITGTLSNQTDLQNALNAKAPVTSGTSLLYGNGSGGFSNASVGAHGNLTFSGGTLDTAQNITTGDSPTFVAVNASTVTAASAADLTLFGGSSGAEIDIGNGSSAANINLTPSGSGAVLINSSLELSSTLQYNTNGNFSIKGNGGGNNNVDIYPGGTGVVRLWAASQTIVVDKTSQTGLIVGVNDSITTAAWGVGGLQLQVPASSYTDSSSSGTVGTVTVFNSFAQPTLAASSAATYTNAATVYIANAPTNGTNATITNPWALYIAAGNSRFAATTASSSTTTGAIVDSGGLGVAGAIYAGSIQATPIGSTTASTGAFTTVTTSSTFSPTPGTSSTNQSDLIPFLNATSAGSQGAMDTNTGLAFNPSTGAFTATSIQNTPIGSSTAAAGTFTTLTAGGGIISNSAPTNGRGTWGLGTVRSGTALVVSTTAGVQITVGGVTETLAVLTTNP